MNRMIAVLLVMLAVSVGADNSTGWRYQWTIDTTLANGELAYGSVWDLSKWENTKLVVKVADTSSAGLSSDSINLAVGYQVGTVTLNFSGLRDTLWSSVIYLDTVRTDSLGKPGSLFEDALGDFYRFHGGVDTSDVSGFACLEVALVPEWGELFRVVLRGITGNNGAEESRYVVEARRRVGASVVTR
jgi:hypothetical protein